MSGETRSNSHRISREAPAFSTTSCEVSGKKIQGHFLGVFATRASRTPPMLPVKAVWRIDRQRNKFVPLKAATCATDGIYTPDGPS